MAPSVVSRTTRYYQTRTMHQYKWPTQQLLVWRFVMYGTGGTLLGINACFLAIQQQLGLGVPWVLPFGTTVGALTIVFLIIMDISLLQKALTPGIVMLGGFMLTVLYLAGMIETALQLFGSPSNINAACNTYVYTQSTSGLSIDTLAWLEQRAICQSWDALFAFWLIGLIFLLWIIVLASQSIHYSSLSWKESHVRYRGDDPQPVVPVQREPGFVYVPQTLGVAATTWRA